MKKKFLGLAAILAILVASVALAACGSSPDIYYEYRNGNYIETSYFELNGDKYSIVSGAESSSGTFKIDGTSLTLYMKIDGNKVECGKGTISNGVISLFDTKGNPYIHYCLKGKTPPEPEKPSAAEKLTVGDVKSALEKLVNGAPYKATADASQSSDKTKTPKAFSGTVEVLGDGFVRFTENGQGVSNGAPDGEQLPEAEHYVVDTNSGYVYASTASGYTFAQYMPQGAIEYILDIIKAQTADVDGKQEIAADGLSYDAKTRTLTYDRDMAGDINEWLDPLYKAYSGNRNVEWLINAYLEKLAPGADIELEDIVDQIIDIAVKNENSTVGDTLKAVEMATKLNILDTIKKYVTDAQYNEITSRKLGQMLMGTINYVESRIAPEFDIKSIIDMLGGETDVKAILAMIFPDGFDLNALYNAAFKDDVSTDGLAQKLADYKKLAMVGIRALYVDDIIDGVLGGENATPQQKMLYFAIQNGITLSKLEVKCALVFDEQMNISSLDASANISHSYEPTATPSAFDDNNFKLAVKVDEIDYGYDGEKWLPEKFADESSPAKLYLAVVDSAKIGDGDIVMNYQWGNVTERTVTVKSVSYSDADGNTHALDNAIVKYNADGTFAFTASGVKQAIALKDYSYTTGITATFDVVAGGDTFTVEVTLIVMTDDANGMLGGLPVIIEKIMGNIGGAPILPDEPNEQPAA